MSADEQQAGLGVAVEAVCRQARLASRCLATADAAARQRLLLTVAETLEKSEDEITAANQIDLSNGEKRGLSAALLDRLKLTPARMQSMIRGCRDVAAMRDPLGEVIRTWTLDSGVEMSKVRVPIGVIGMIYESRPNVTIDAAVLCLKAGNAVVLRGGSEADASNRILHRVMQEAASACGFDPGVVGMLPSTERAAIPLFCKQSNYVDLMIPRGGHGLIKTVVEHATMPVIKHYHGVCHVYVHEKADVELAEKLVVNAKCQRPGVCNAAETLLVDRAVAASLLPRLTAALESNGVELFADMETSKLLGRKLAEPEHWSVEYLDLKMAVKVVENLDAAIAHIEEFGSHHSDCIVTEVEAAAELFLRKVDSAAVYWNASTRFTDGSQFGFGAEIGISTDKIHARGPMGLEELTSYKYVGRGKGEIRI